MTPDDERTEETQREPVLLHFFREPTLWPVTAVMVLAFTSFGGTVLAFAALRQNLVAYGAVGALLLASFRLVDPEVRERRLGPVTAVVLGMWLACSLAAWAFIATGLY